jgi:acid phosphatase
MAATRREVSSVGASYGGAVERCRRDSRSQAALLAACLMIAACAPPPSLRAPTATPPSEGVTPSSITPAQPVRVAVIVLENRGYDSVLGLPYISTVASTATALTDYHASGHPSLPNYLALTSGSTLGVTDDGYHVLPQQDLGDQLTAAGLPWRAYMEGMGADCLAGTGGYAVKHDPFAYYGGRCPSSVVPFTQFSTDLAGAAVPRFIWITPNLCHDMHDCDPTVGDTWLRQTVPVLLASPAMSNGVVVITWDEDDSGGSNHVLTLVLGSKRAANPRAAYSHPSLLATIEDLLGLARLPATRGVAAIAVR